MPTPWKLRFCEISLPFFLFPSKPWLGSFALIESHAEFVSQAKSGNLGVQFSTGITSLPTARVILRSCKKADCLCVKKNKKKQKSSTCMRKKETGKKFTNKYVFIIIIIISTLHIFIFSCGSNLYFSQTWDPHA